MADGMSHLFWDSCVFYAFLREESASYDVQSIEQYLSEARDGKHKIYASSLVFAEIIPSAIKKPGIGSCQQFIHDLQGAVIIIDASPNVMHIAGTLKDLPYKKGNSSGRRLSTTDAIMLASCLELKEAFGVKVDFFHTFDDGKKRGPEGKMVPLISYEDWCTEFAPDQKKIADPVIGLNRRRPIHPTPGLFSG